MGRQKALLLIFVKHPVAGQVKTRLAKGIGNVKALAVYKRLLQHTLYTSRLVSVDKAVFFGNEIPDTDLWQIAGYDRYPQQGMDLGGRMQHAFQWGFDKGYQEIVIIGSDCPGISGDILSTAFAALDKTDFVIGPAVDGGYYLMGMKELFSSVFEDKEWSGPSVLADSLNDLRLAGKSITFMPELNDVDEAGDLIGTWLEDLNV